MCLFSDSFYIEVALQLRAGPPFLWLGTQLSEREGVDPVFRRRNGAGSCDYCAESRRFAVNIAQDGVQVFRRLASASPAELHLDRRPPSIRQCENRVDFISITVSVVVNLPATAWPLNYYCGCDREVVIQLGIYDARFVACRFRESFMCLM